jgi:hypothetical protein
VDGDPLTSAVPPRGPKELGAGPNRNEREMALLLLAAGACWIAAFGLFELVYGPMLLTWQTDRTSGDA